MGRKKDLNLVLKNTRAKNLIKKISIKNKPIKWSVILINKILILDNNNFFKEFKKKDNNLFRKINKKIKELFRINYW